MEKKIWRKKFFEDRELFFCSESWEKIIKKKRKKGKFPDFEEKKFIFGTFFEKSAQNSILFKIFPAEKKVEDRELFFAQNPGRQ